MPISIYNYEKSKIPLILDMVQNTSLRKMQKNYYIDSDWQYGPNTLIVFRNDSDKQLILDELKEFIPQYTSENIVPEGHIAQKKVQYKKSQKVLSEVEMRDGIYAGFLYDHGFVCSRPKKYGIYNSHYHREAFDNYRYELNDLYLRFLPEYENMSEKERAHLFLHMFIFITTLFEDGPTRGYLTFLSHAQGFLSNIEARGLNSNIQATFEERRIALFKDNKIIVKDDLKVLVDEWETKWKRIAKEMNEKFAYSNYEGDGGIDLKPQLELLKKSLSTLRNKFHGNLLKMNETKLEEFILSKKMLVFRDIVNLFYLMLPLFEQSMVKKQFYAYSTVKYFEEYFNDKLLYRIE